ncbi:MAG: hypothetical protein JNM27_09645 [Leptospirales bacterium]|nr:hypothetical protein [Leptospirales bacterium]
MKPSVCSLVPGLPIISASNALQRATMFLLHLVNDGGLDQHRQLVALIVDVESGEIISMPLPVV